MKKCDPSFFNAAEPPPNTLSQVITRLKVWFFCLGGILSCPLLPYFAKVFSLFFFFFFQLDEDTFLSNV